MQFALAITEVTHSNKYSIYCLMIRKKDINFLLVFTLCKQKNHQMISLITASSIDKTYNFMTKLLHIFDLCRTGLGKKPLKAGFLIT